MSPAIRGHGQTEVPPPDMGCAGQAGGDPSDVRRGEEEAGCGPHDLGRREELLCPCESFGDYAVSDLPCWV